MRREDAQNEATTLYRFCETRHGLCPDVECEADAVFSRVDIVEISTSGRTAIARDCVLKHIRFGNVEDAAVTKG